jgi:hypothetical protein
MTITKYPLGAAVKGMPVVGTHMSTGNAWFVHHTGSNDFAGTAKEQPFADLDYAIGMVTENQGDTIFVMPGHAETASTQITCDMDGMNIIGLGRGRNRPAITANASAVDLMNVTGDNVYIENLRFVGAASCTAFINVAGPDFIANHCQFDGVATPAIHVTIAALANRFEFVDCVFYSEDNGVTSAIKIESPNLTGGIIRDNVFNFGAVGCDNGVILSEDDWIGGLVSNNVFIGVTNVAIDFNSSSQANCEGVISDNAIVCMAANANIDVLIDAGGYACLENYGTDIPGEGGGRIPVTTVDEA